MPPPSGHCISPAVDESRAASAAESAQHFCRETPTHRKLDVEPAHPHRVLPLAGAFDRGDMPHGDQGIAVDAQEARLEFLLERLQRFLDEILAASVAHRY